MANDYTNNSKYAGEVWIENGKEEGFKTAFLNALFRQWQGHSDDLQNPKFNADMLDGYHASYFENLINDVIGEKVDNFYIGDSYFHDSKKYTIGIESIHLYPENENIPEGEMPNGLSTYNDLLNSIQFPWNSSEEYTINNLRPSDNPPLYDIIKELYYQLQHDLDEKTDNADFTAFKDSQEEFNDYWENKFSNFNFTEDGIDATSVNGLRFFVVTQNQYEEDYDDEDRRDLHNVFIIKDAEDFPNPSNPVYENNPNNARWNKYYVFKIDLAEYEGETVKCLLYKLNDEAETEWKVIAPVSDFIDNEYIQSMVGDSLTVNDELFENIMRAVTLDNPIHQNLISQIPLTQYYNSKYISGAYFPVYSLSNGNIIKTDDRQEVRIVPKDDERFLDFSFNNTNNKNPLDSLKDALLGKINSVNSALNSLSGGAAGTLKQAETNIRGNANSISNLSGGAAGTLKQAETSISGLESRVNTLENDKVSYGKLSWKKYLIPGLVSRQYSAADTTYFPGNTKTHPIQTRSACFFNINLSLGVLHFNFTHLHKKGDEGKWVEPNFNTSTTIKEKVQNPLHFCVFAPPMASVVHTTAPHPGDNFIRIDPVGSYPGRILVYVRNAPKKSSADGYDEKGRWQYIHFYGQVTYRPHNEQTVARLTQFNLTNFEKDFSNWNDVLPGSPIDYENWEY